MEALSSLRDFYHLHRREVHRYGFLVGLFIAALWRDAWLLAALCLPAAAFLYSYDRWLEPWRQRGEALLKRKP
ncbi:MAG: hypothetical protein ACO1TE_12340 [Prosthecobacter sp.]